MAIKPMIAKITKAQFLVEHNKLSPQNLKATMPLLTRFKEEKRPLLKDNAWSVDKLRIPFISWLLAFSSTEKKDEKQKDEHKFRSYPQTK